MFIAIGILSIYYSNTSVKVDVDGIINPDSVDILSPNMDRGVLHLSRFQDLFLICL